jgi:transposase InsO family protein
MRKKFPFPIKAIQLPPRTPKLNGHVEKANKTYMEEFYEVQKLDLSLEEYNRQLGRVAFIYNSLRPH